jgi:hypothetical protein
MAACKTGGATFSVAQLDVGQSSQAAQTLAL